MIHAMLKSSLMKCLNLTAVRDGMRICWFKKSSPFLIKNSGASPERYEHMVLRNKDRSNISASSIKGIPGHMTERGCAFAVEKTIPDGRSGYIKGHPVEHGNGDIGDVVEPTPGISERKRAEEALRESEKDLSGFREPACKCHQVYGSYKEP